MKLVISFFCLCLLLSCTQRKSDGIRLEQALSMADGNRKELEKVLEHYQDDTLKLKAAQYLIRNMPFHFSREEYFQSSDGERYILNVADFTDNQEVTKHCDSLQAEGYSVQKKLVYDSKVLSSDYLIKNIDLAFEVWQKPWARELDFEYFCHYILPYRSQTEPISDLRRELMEYYLQLLDTTLVKKAFEACMIVNAQLMTDLKYKKTGNPFYPTIEETYSAKIGECDALCNFVTYVMRAVGIPVVVQKTIWTRMNLGHSWCAVLQDGKFYDFSPAYVQPNVYRHRLATTNSLKPAKIYRYFFEPEFREMKVEDDGFVTFLKSPLLRDVTIEGESLTFDLRVTAHKAVSNTKQVYLCAYNNSRWEPLAIGVLKDSICEFVDVSGNNIFIVAEAIDKHNLRYITVPFLAKADGSVHKLVPDIHKVEHVELSQHADNSSIELYYWDIGNNQFKFINCDSVNEGIQHYTKIRANSLLLSKSTHQSTGILGVIERDSLINICDF